MTYFNGESEGHVHNDPCKYLTKAVPSKDIQASPRRQYQLVPFTISDQADYAVMENIGARKSATGRPNFFWPPLPPLLHKKIESCNLDALKICTCKRK